MLVFKTKADGQHVVINGVGRLPARGKGGIVVDDAAARGLQELQQRDEDGQIVRDEQGVPVPLTGKALNDAARAFAEQAGIEVAVEKEEHRDRIREELGLPPESKPALEVARETYERQYGKEVVQPGEEGDERVGPGVDMATEAATGGEK